MKKSKILVVDDVQFDRELIKMAIERAGESEVIEARNGVNALECLQTQSVDLVLMDLEMPEMNGPTTITEIRKKFSASQLPIIMLSSHGEDSAILECLQLGANDYLTKPINFQITLMRIQNQLRILEAAKKQSDLKKMSALNAMVFTYHHQINNPLAIAQGALHKILKNKDDPRGFEMLQGALTRIDDIVKKIKVVSESTEVEIQSNEGMNPLVKIK